MFRLEILSNLLYLFLTTQTFRFLTEVIYHAEILPDSLFVRDWYVKVSVIHNTFECGRGGIKSIMQHELLQQMYPQAEYFTTIGRVGMWQMFPILLYNLIECCFWQFVVR